MPDEKIQLKREDIVGDEVVLSDINPVTSTKSVYDSSTGNELSQTLDKIWNSINNKLSRVVNSVNGRTGVVVLTADDVGLGDVTNVSFADIKEWVLNQMTNEFGYKRFDLYDSLTEVQILVNNNNREYQNKSFYASTISSTDKRSCIGYIYLNESEDKLAFEYRAINTVGYTDYSLIYNEKISDTKDFTGGGLGVNIHPYEDALELYIGDSKGDSGLKIRKDKLVGEVYYMDGVYGDGETPSDSDLLCYNETNINEYPIVDLTIDDTIYTDERLRFGYSSTGLKVGDFIILDFKDYRIWSYDDVTKKWTSTIPDGMNFLYMCRPTMIGRVDTAPDESTGVNKYSIRFKTIRNYPGWGLKQETQTYGDHTNQSLEIKLNHAKVANASDALNISGLQMISDTDNPNYTSNIPSRVVSLPEGINTISQTAQDGNVGGLYIQTDLSLCVMPNDLYGTTSNYSHLASNRVENWNIQTGLPSSVSGTGISNMNYLGINLNKAISQVDAANNPDLLHFENASGLKITKAGSITGTEAGFVQNEWLGGAIDLNSYETGGTNADNSKVLEYRALLKYTSDGDTEPMYYLVTNNYVTLTVGPDFDKTSIPSWKAAKYITKITNPTEAWTSTEQDYPLIPTVGQTYNIGDILVAGYGDRSATYKYLVKNEFTVDSDLYEGKSALCILENERYKDNTVSYPVKNLSETTSIATTTGGLSINCGHGLALRNPQDMYRYQGAWSEERYYGYGQLQVNHDSSLYITSDGKLSVNLSNCPQALRNFSDGIGIKFVPNGNTTQIKYEDSFPADGLYGSYQGFFVPVTSGSASDFSTNKYSFSAENSLMLNIPANYQSANNIGKSNDCTGVGGLTTDITNAVTLNIAGHDTSIIMSGILGIDTVWNLEFYNKSSTSSNEEPVATYYPLGKNPEAGKRAKNVITKKIFLYPSTGLKFVASTGDYFIDIKKIDE